MRYLKAFVVFVVCSAHYGFAASVNGQEGFTLGGDRVRAGGENNKNPKNTGLGGAVPKPLTISAEVAEL